MLSAVILTKNEEKNIVDCIENLRFCDEIIIVDEYSTDRTIEILSRLSKENSKIKIFERRLGNDFSKQRQFGINKASFDWIFFVDADERIPAKLSTEIKEKLTELVAYDGFLVKRVDFLWGKELKYGETGNIKLLRLFNKKKGNLKGKVHEIWETKSEVGYLINHIEHFPHPTISEFLKKINFYTDLRAEELYFSKEKIGFLSIILYPSGKFIKNYFFKLGFLDGIEGLIHATIMSFHSFLVRGKLWQLSQKNIK